MDAPQRFLTDEALQLRLRVAMRLGEGRQVALAEEAVTLLEQTPGPALVAADAAGLYAEAVARWQGNLPERADALLGQGRCLRALGRPGAEEPLREAPDLFYIEGLQARAGPDRGATRADDFAGLVGAADSAEALRFTSRPERPFVYLSASW